MRYNKGIKREVAQAMFTIQASGDGWEVVRPSGIVMHLQTLKYALFIAEGFPVQVLDKAGNRLA